MQKANVCLRVKQPATRTKSLLMLEYFVPMASYTLATAHHAGLRAKEEDYYMYTHQVYTGAGKGGLHRDYLIYNSAPPTLQRGKKTEAQGYIHRTRREPQLGFVPMSLPS